jgi:hypothetical protein
MDDEAAHAPSAATEPGSTDPGSTTPSPEDAPPPWVSSGCTAFDRLTEA